MGVRTPAAPKRLTAARTVIRAMGGSEQVYERVIGQLRERGVDERDVERHNLFYAELVAGELGKARAIAGRVRDRELKDGLRALLAAYQESSVGHVPSSS